MLKQMMSGMIALSLVGQVAFAKDRSSLEHFTRTVNLLSTEKDLSSLSKKMEGVADALEKRGDVAQAKNLRAAARPDSLAMTRAYLRSEIEKKDVNGLYLVMTASEGDGFCDLPYSATYANKPYMVEYVVTCLTDIFLSVITLGEKNVSASESL